MARQQQPRGGRKRTGTRPLGDIAADILDPVLVKKAGMSSALAVSWADIVGARLAGISRPERLRWPPRRSEDDPFEPATLVVACEGSGALFLQHQTGELIARVNAMFGFAAVARIQIVQRPVHVERPSHKPTLRTLGAEERRKIAELTQTIEDPALRAALTAYGESLAQRRRTPK
ncbi:DUF721 domain-containing protein [Consotaella aegiceratis]|uniref:DUF721 domain-containing protein n=1 Tax=Consotaella aegiceratis TaxID=3097961 RepID=UPI002F3E7F75